MSTIILILLLIIALMGFFWGAHVAIKNDDLGVLQNKHDIISERLSLLRESRDRREVVPLRTMCRCKHDVYQHDRGGCHAWKFVFGECGCLATPEQVMYDPEPIRKMLSL